jgi:hypothetical protein
VVVVVVVADVDDELQPASRPTVATPKAKAVKLVLRCRRIRFLRGVREWPAGRVDRSDGPHAG